MNHKIALCQLLPDANNAEANFLRMHRVVADCSKQNIKLVIFPEDFLFGVLRTGDELINASQNFEKWLQVFSRLAKEYQLDIVPGSLPSGKNGKFFNTAVYINKFGKVLVHYSKTNLWLSERKEYTSNSNHPQVFNSILGRTAIFICWDILDHRLFELAVKQGVEWIIIPAFWSVNQSMDHQEQRGHVNRKYKGFSDSQMIDSLIQARVNEYNIGIIFCNFAGTHSYVGDNGVRQNAISANRTQIVTPFYYFTKKFTNRKEQIMVLEIPYIRGQIRDFEIYYGRRADIKSNYPYGHKML